jgi:predicted glycosyltransferase
MFKHIIDKLKPLHEILILATKKDVLENLLQERKLNYINVLPEGRKDNKLSIAIGLLKQDIRLFKICRKYKPDLLIGTSTEITHIGKLLGIKSLFFIEDDIKVVPLVGILAHPFASYIISPSVCDNGKWNKKTIKYLGYQKLAYLHPSVFKPDRNLVDNKFNSDKPIFMIRLSKLGAHHDSGISGISKALLLKIVDILKQKGNILISSESTLPDEFSEYKINININDIHHYLSFSDLLISDSQSMSVEAAMLGTPSIRISSFSGKISVLEELEHNYHLTFGIQPEKEEYIIKKVTEIIGSKSLKQDFKKLKIKMLSEKINVTEFISWLIDHFPESITAFKNNPDIQNNFKTPIKDLETTYN